MSAIVHSLISRQIAQALVIVCGLLALCALPVRAGSYAIHGVITDAAGAPVSGITVTCSVGNFSAVTDDTGAYAIQVSDTIASYQITPVSQDRLFQPPSRTVYISGDDATANFVACAGQRAPLLPDITVPSVQFLDDTPSVEYWGRVKHVSATVKNLGTANTSTFRVKWYLVVNYNNNPQTVELTTLEGATYETITNIAPSAQYTLNRYVKLPVTPPNNIDGQQECRLLVKADVYNAVSESNESNNEAVSSDDITLEVQPTASMKPDMIGYRLECTTDPTRWGGAFRVAFTIANIGNGPTTGAFNIRWYLSKTQSMTDARNLYRADAIYQYTYGITDIIPARSFRRYTAYLRLESPAFWQNSLNYIIMDTDSSSVIFESNELNNRGALGLGYDIASLVISSTTATQPDLIGAVLSGPQGAAYWGTAIRVDARIANLNKVSAGPFRVRWYLSQNTTVGTGDILLTQLGGATYMQHAGLDPTHGQYLGAPFFVYLKLPTAKPEGWTDSPIYVVMETDADAQVAESNEMNNLGGTGDQCDYDQITVYLREMMPKFPDLFGGYLRAEATAPGGITWGSALKVSARINNAGDAVAGPFRVAFYLSTDRAFSADDLVLPLVTGANYYTHAGLGVMQQGPIFTVYLKMPVTASSRRYLIMYTDPHAQIVEHSEMNNRGEVGSGYDYVTFSIANIAAGTDLLGVSLSAPPSAEWGTALPVQAMVINGGNAAVTNAAKLEWYLSRDSQGSADDLLLPLVSQWNLPSSTYQYTNGNVPAASVAFSRSFYLKLPDVLPDGWAGSYFYLIMKTDASSNITEQNEANNFGQVGLGYDKDYLKILTPATKQPDLHGVSLRSSKTEIGIAGDTITVTATIQNSGNVSAGPFAVRWYLSKDRVGNGTDQLLSLTNSTYAYSHAGIPAAARGIAISANLKLPADAWGATYYVIMRTDALYQVAESNENNNFGQMGYGIDYVPIDIGVIK